MFASVAFPGAETQFSPVLEGTALHVARLSEMVECLAA
jgi:hypothetical protein